MKRVLFSLLISLSVLCTACFETETETAVNADGSGTLTVLMDMSKMFDLMGAMGKDSIEKIDDEPAQDSTFGFKDKASEVEKNLGRPLTDEEKALLEKTTGRLQLNVKEKMMKVTIRSEFTKLNQLTFLQEIQKKGMDDLPVDDNDAPQGEADEKMKELAGKPASALSFVVKDGLIENVFDKTKYQLSAEDEAMTKQIDQAGILLGEMPVKLIYRLPRPVKNITAGAKYELSEDKKTVTIRYSFLETFKDPGVQAYKIEY